MALVQGFMLPESAFFSPGFSTREGFRPQALWQKLWQSKAQKSQPPSLLGPCFFPYILLQNNQNLSI